MGAGTSLDVFLSSAQHEFERTRRKLAKRIGSIPFLTCTPLEQAGADPDSATSASLRGVREADIYIGVFGKTHSRTTIAEYREAVKHRKPALVYVQRVKNRDKRVRVFIESELKNEFKFHPFTDARGLYKQSDADLRKLLLRLLHAGLQRIRETKETVVEIERKRSPSAEATRTNLPATRGRAPSQAIDALNEAVRAFSNSSFLAAVLLARSSVELGLKVALARRQVSISSSRMRSFSGLVEAAQASGLVTTQDLNEIRQLSYLRNDAAHEGRVPTKADVGWAIEVARRLLSKWELGDS